MISLQINMKTPRLIKFKIFMETEVVAEEVYSQPLQKTAEEVRRTNRTEILSQACESGDVSVSDPQVIKSLNELPVGWCGDCLPWLSVTFGDKEPSGKIEDFFKK